MSTWDALDEEFDRWAAAGRVATLWWRDDDAGAPSAALDRLFEARRALGTPLAVAAVPAWLGAEGAGRIGAEDVDVLQHGWDHTDHAAPGAKKVELGGRLHDTASLAALERGRAVLARLPNTLPVLVPPWNRIAESLVGRLAGAGWRGLSRFGPRRRAAGGPVTVNTHVDIVAWHHGRGFVGEDAALTAAIDHLRARREGTVDGGEPTGLLTHHAVHDAACWRFVDRFAAAVAGHGGARWVSAREAFGIGP
ncbi:MAG: hypothetical protein FJX36_04555 [Alphaproteobacteria bacterium]|nr:hypothetical protein [Alphaproteobacteria bacterium]